MMIDRFESSVKELLRGSLVSRLRDVPSIEKISEY